MPHFDEHGRDTVICQLCGRTVSEATWRPDLTRNKSAGNVCAACVAKSKEPRRAEPLLSLYEHCRLESGLSGEALREYINRYYGHE